MKFKFRKPYKFEEKEYKEVEVNVDALTGEDMMIVKKEFSDSGNFVMVPATDWDFCVRVAARASKLPIEFFLRMPAPEYCRLATAVSNFLLV